MSAYRIDTEVVSLGRRGKTVVYIIGAKPWEPDKPQLWVDKDLRAPIRLISLDPNNSSIVDVQLIGLGSAQTEEWFPRRIEVRRDGALVETTTY